METLAEFRAKLDEMGLEAPQPKDATKPMSPGNRDGYDTNPNAKWLKPASVMLTLAIEALATGKYAPPEATPKVGVAPPSPALSRRVPKLDRNTRAKMCRLLEGYNRRTREVGASGRRNQGALKSSGVEIGKALMYDWYNVDTGQLDPSDDTIATATGWSVRTVARARERLRASGLLSWFRRSKWVAGRWSPTSNRYAFGQLGRESSGRLVIEWGKRAAAPPSALILTLASEMGVAFIGL